MGEASGAWNISIPLVHSQCHGHGHSVLCHGQWTGKLPLLPHITYWISYTSYTFYASIHCQVLTDALALRHILIVSRCEFYLSSS